MQKGADYGSQNLEEESAFIRRVVAPPKRNDNTRRRQKRVAAAVGASVVLLAAGAIATYASIPSENASTIATTETLEADAMARPVTLPPVEEDDVDDATDDSTPNPDDALFALYDANGDGTVTKDEYIAQLTSNRDEALAKVEASTRLSPDEKTELVRKLNSNFAVESSCATKLAKRDIVSNGEVTSDRFPIFYHMIKQFCLLEDVNIPEEYRPTDPPVEQIEVPEEQPVEEFTPPAYEEMNPVQEPTPAYEEPAVEEDNTPANNPEVVEDEKKEDNVEQAAESGDETAVKEVEQQADEVEQAAESGDAAAVAEEEHHEAEVEQAAEEGNPAAQQEEEHHEEQVEEADVEAPPAVKEEENKIDEVEQSAESGDQTAVEEVEQKEDELVQEAESGDAEAAQEEEHIEAAVEEAASEGNPAAQEEEDHHEEEVQQSEETQEAESPSKPWSPESSTSESPAVEQQTWSEIPETTSEEDNQAPAEDWLSPVVDELATPTPEEEAPKADTPTVNGQTYMTKPEFRSKISDHFQDLEGVVAQRLQLAELEVKKVGLLKDLLEECIDQASNKFGYYGVYERDDIFNDAVTWVKDDCLAV